MRVDDSVFTIAPLSKDRPTFQNMHEDQPMTRRRLATPLWRLALAVLFVSLTATAQQEPLTIQRAIDLALSRNERTTIAQANIEAADARLRRARSFFFPELAITSTYTRRAYETTRRIGDEDVTIQSFNAFNSGLNVTGTIFDARAFPLYRQARLERERVRLDAADERRLISFEAADSFITTLSFEQLASAARRRRDFAHANLNDAQARFEAGLVSSNDVTRAELEVATAERELAQAGGDVRIAYVELGHLLNTEVSGPLGEPTQLLRVVEQPATIAAADITAAQSRRSDLEAARRHVEALREFASEPSRRFIPTLGFFGQFRSTNESGLSGRNNDGFASFTMTWPLFDGGERTAERAERLAQVRAAELDLALTSREVALDLRRALEQISSDQAAIEQAVTAVRVAGKNAEESLELYRQGLAGSLEVTDASVRLFEAEVALARARYQLALAYLDLRSASGLTPATEENRS